MKRNDLYIIGRKNFEAQQIGDVLGINLAKTESDNGASSIGFGSNDYYHVLFGKDSKGRMYMALALKEYGVGEWHGAHKVNGHWHGAGCSHFVRCYHIKLRKNFKDADEANRYYNIVKANMYNRTVQQTEDESRHFTEAQIDKLFA